MIYGLMIAALVAVVHIAATCLMAIWRGVVARRNIFVSTQLPKNWPFVSVIVPAWNEHGTLEPCINTLHAVDYPDWEAIIIAGGQDGTYEAAVEDCKDLKHFRVLEQQPCGKNAALNQGLSLARGEIIILLDADSQVSPGWLRALVAPIDQIVGATTGQPVPLRRTPISQGEQMEQIAAYHIRGIVTLQGSGSIALHRRVVEQMGGFPEDVIVGVDWDLNARLAARGVKYAFCPQATVKTERPATLREYWRNEVRWRRAHLASLFRLYKHFLGSPVTAIFNLYIYILSWFTAFFTFLVGVIALTQIVDSKIIASEVWIVFIAWLLLRRAALAIEVAVYSRDLSWLKMAWVPPLLLCVTLTAILPATLTLKRSGPHFKGPRLRGYINRAG